MFSGQSLKDLDSYADKAIDVESKHPVGGLLTIIFYPLIAAWVIWYIVGCVITGNNLSTSTSIIDFTEDANNSVSLPPMTCIAPGGCFVHPMVVPNPSNGQYPGFSCYYLRQGEDFPLYMRQIFLSPDPVESLSIIFNNSQSFFGVSYDQVRVVDFRTGETVVRVRGRVPNAPGSPQIYQGSSLMQLTSTSRPSYYEEDSWASVSSHAFLRRPGMELCFRLKNRRLPTGGDIDARDSN